MAPICSLSLVIFIVSAGEATTFMSQAPWLEQRNSVARNRKSPEGLRKIPQSSSAELRFDASDRFHALDCDGHASSRPNPSRGGSRYRFASRKPQALADAHPLALLEHGVPKRNI